jgi:hypothetical protein
MGAMAANGIGVDGKAKCVRFARTLLNEVQSKTRKRHCDWHLPHGDDFFLEKLADFWRSI